MSTKKDKERKVFDFVYADRVLESITPSEEPDFRVKNTDGEFGVEITEFYSSHSNARLNNIPGYFMEIIEDKKYRHKDDIVPLEVKEFTVEPGDNRRPNFKVEGLIQKRPTISEHVSKISELIEKKNMLFNRYIAGLNHVNLIVCDYESILLGVPKDTFHDLFFQPCLEKVLMDADFREIFFVTQLGEFETSKKMYIPLKMLFLIAEIYLFNYIMIEKYSDMLLTMDLKNKNILMVEYLVWRGAKNVYFRDSMDGFEIFYGNTGLLPNGEQILVRDYTDFALSGDFNLFKKEDVSQVFDGTFLSIFEKYKRESTFRMSLGFDIGGSK